MTISTNVQAKAIAELAKRRMEALRLFRPLPHQVPFFRCQAREILARGGNRAGKSLVSAIRFAALAMDQPVTTVEGDQIYIRQPSQKSRELTQWVIGLGVKHIGQTLHRLLFRPGLFKIVRNPQTKQWESYRPWDKIHAGLEDKAKPSPPLIPPRYINPNSWSWENKGEKVFTKVEIWNPETHAPLSTIYAFTSSGDVKAGDPVDEIWIDERVKYPQYYPEWQARLIDRRGRLVWSSWPDITNDALLDMTKRAQDQLEEENPRVVEFLFRMSNNPHLPKESVEDAIKEWSDEERRARDQGEYITDTLRMYPRFDPMIHTAIVPEGRDEDRLSAVLRQRGGQPPEDWTRELVLDPGTTNPAVLLCAVPPPEFGDYVVPYQEIYIPRLDADQLAEKVLMYTQGQHFERFIIDPMAGRQKPMGFGHTVQGNYSRAFESRGLVSARTGNSFSPGSNDVPGRILNLQSWMIMNPDGFPKLRVVTEHCPNLCRQLVNYRKQLQAGDPLDFRPAKGQKIDLAVCLEYWASRRPEWVSHPAGRPGLSPSHKSYLRLKKKFGANKRPANSGLRLGPAQE